MQGCGCEVHYSNSSFLFNNDMTDFMTSSEGSLQHQNAIILIIARQGTGISGLSQCCTASLTCNGSELTIKGKERWWRHGRARVGFVNTSLLAEYFDCKSKRLPVSKG